ncbi:MAG: hypothetical protein ACKO6F_06605 [Cyanobium sp.]
MSAPQYLLQAAVNRLAARLGSGLADTAAGLAVLAQDAPERLRRELDLFREEVEQEADRLERGGSAEGSDVAAATGDAASDPQDQIDALRARVAELSRRLEQPAAPTPGGGGAGSR